MRERKMMKAEHRRIGRRAAHRVGLGLLACVVVLWSWNAVAADLLGAPAMAFRHALALLLLVMTLATAGGWAARSHRLPFDRRGS